MCAHPLAAAGVLVFALATTADAQQTLGTEFVVGGLTSPNFATSAPGDDASRMFIVTQPGQIRLYSGGALLPTPFLDVSAKLVYGGEQGLLGLAFHPDYESNGYFFVNYTDSTGGDTVIERYQVDPNNADVALPASAFPIIEIDQPYSNHNGGWIGFGPDGFLYVGMGDGGAGGDPGNRAQDGQQLLGKILRLDVDHPGVGTNYGIPASNPFVGNPAFLDEIWAYGMRNPWRCDFDPLTGDLWISDVGQASWEEVNYEPAAAGGRNYGWRIMEGNHCFNPSSGCNSAGLELPIHEYDRSGGRCSVIGGFVYRGRNMARMHGRYFFLDWCGGQTYSMRQLGGVEVDFWDHTSEIGINGGNGWGEDADGELYVCKSTSIHRVIPTGFRIKLPHMTAGSAVTASISGATPSSFCGLFFSKYGMGSTRLPAAQVRLDIAGAELLGLKVTSGQGTTSFTGTVPTNLQDRTLWLQAAQMGSKSNVVVESVE